VNQAVTQQLASYFQGDQAAWENAVTTKLAPYLQQAGYSQQQIEQLSRDVSAVTTVLAIPGVAGALSGSGGAPSWGNTPIDTTNPYG
jgi:hypothetical protein